MRSSAAHCYDHEIAQDTSVFCIRRPALYLASVRHADGCVVTFDPAPTPRTCANDSTCNPIVRGNLTRTYATDSYYRKGLLLREQLNDGQGRPFTETTNTYELRNLVRNNRGQTTVSC